MTDVVSFGFEPLLVKKRVVFRPASSTDTLKTGYALCYNYDLVEDWQENTQTAPDGPDAVASYAEGNQEFNARFLTVEKPLGKNIDHFAGWVCEESDGAGDGEFINIYVPVEGAVIPVYTDLSVANSATVLAVNPGSYAMGNPVYGGSTTSSVMQGIALETINRSSVNGLTWMLVKKGLSLGLGVSTNLVIGAASTGEIIPFIISAESPQTGGTFNMIRIRAELTGAGASGGTSGGLALRVEGVVNGNTATHTSAASTHLIFKTGNTPSAGLYAGLWVKLENQDSTPADLAAVDVCVLWISMQNNDAPNQSCMIYFDSDGSDDPDYLFVAKTASAISGVVSITNAPVLATGDVMAKVKITGGAGNGDWYIPLMADSGQ